MLQGPEPGAVFPSACAVDRVRHHGCMLWAICIGIICAAVAFLVARRLERGERDAFVATLSPFDRTRLQIFEGTGRTWRQFREEEEGEE